MTDCVTVLYVGLVQCRVSFFACLALSLDSEYLVLAYRFPSVAPYSVDCI